MTKLIIPIILKIKILRKDLKINNNNNNNNNNN